MESNNYNSIPSLDNPSQIFNMSGRTIVILGGVGKMGQQFATILGLAGANVVISDLDKDKCEIIAGTINREKKLNISGMVCDVSDELEVRDFFQSVYKKYGTIDGMIFNVMAKPEGYYRPFEKYPTETWQNVVNGNLSGAFLCCREVLQYMQTGASIVLTSSTYGVVGADQRIYENCSGAENIYGGGRDPLNCPASYAATKSALIGFGRHLAVANGKKGIRVNILTPGGVYDGQEEAFHKEYVHRTPLGRMAVWTDYNGAILFLMSDASSI